MLDQESSAARLVANARIRLTATWLNGLSVVALVAGLVLPLVTTLGLFEPAPSESYLPPLVATLAWIGAGLLLHLMARRLLHRLMPEGPA